jgi:hypothetical protein
VRFKNCVWLVNSWFRSAVVAEPRLPINTSINVGHFHTSRLKGFRLRNYFVVYTVFLYSLHVYVVRPSSGGHVYVGN